MGLEAKGLILFPLCFSFLFAFLFFLAGAGREAYFLLWTQGSLLSGLRRSYVVPKTKPQLVCVQDKYPMCYTIIMAPRNLLLAMINCIFFFHFIFKLQMTHQRKLMNAHFNRHKNSGQKGKLTFNQQPDFYFTKE